MKESLVISEETATTKASGLRSMTKWFCNKKNELSIESKGINFVHTFKSDHTVEVA